MSRCTRSRAPPMGTTDGPADRTPTVGLAVRGFFFPRSFSIVHVPTTMRPRSMSVCHRIPSRTYSYYRSLLFSTTCTSTGTCPPRPAFGGRRRRRWIRRRCRWGATHDDARRTTTSMYGALTSRTVRYDANFLRRVCRTRERASRSRSRVDDE